MNVGTSTVRLIHSYILEAFPKQFNANFLSNKIFMKIRDTKIKLREILGTSHALSSGLELGIPVLTEPKTDIYIYLRFIIYLYR